MIEQWLASAGFGKHISAFRDQGIEYGDLTDLTDDDLREIGFTIGERKRFRRALAQSRAAVLAGERRPLTLAFFDLVDSSALFEELDVEDMVEVLHSYRELCSAAIHRFGGSVTHLLGDGILASFCYPVAHENDAERAVHAALEITRGVPLLKSPVARSLAVRCGIATGRVVVTDLFSGSAADKHAVTGSTANLAARLQSLASKNGVVISETTWRRVDHQFECLALPAQKLKGFVQPINAYVVRELRVEPRRPEEAGPHVLTPFVNREDELRRLRELWQRAVGGKGEVGLIHSEPGIGKSRLVGQFISAIGIASRNVIRLHASYFEEHSVLGPFLAYVRRRLKVSDGASEGEIIERLRDTESDFDDARNATLAAFLAGKTTEDDEDPATTEARRRLALDAFVRHFASEASLRPVALCVEDAHWLDPSSKELIGILVAMRPRIPLLLLITSRYDLAGTFPGLEADGVEEIALAPLNTESIHVMVRSIFGDEPVPRDLAERITERSDGIPLFIEELLRPLISASVISDWSSAVRGSEEPEAVPPTLHEVLAARLDRLGPAREVAQVASVIGRSIDLNLLSHVLSRPRDLLDETIASLFASGILRREPGGPEDAVAFSHALVRDAAYDSLLREQRQILHVRVADALRTQLKGFAQRRPEMIAMHLSAGGKSEDALPFWVAAGRQAAARSAFPEARHALQRAAAIAEAMAQTPQIVETRLEIASLLGPVLFAVCGPGSKESRAVYENAVALTEDTEVSRPHFAVLWGWWRLTYDFRVKADRARQLMAIARRRGEPEMLLQAHHCNWASCFHAGDLAGSCRHIAEGLEAYDTAQFEHRPWLFGNHDAKVCAHGELAQIKWLRAELDGALAHESEAVSWARSIGHAGSSAHAFDCALAHRFYRRDVAGVRRLAQEMIKFAEEQRMAEACARGELYLGWTLAQDGAAADGLKMFESAYRAQRRVGTDEDTPVYLTMCAEILNQLGEHERALEELNEARNELDTLNICNWIPEVWRLIGETALRASPSNADTAREAFAKAASIAQQQGATMLKIRALASRLPLCEAEERSRVADLMTQALRSVSGSSSDPDVARALTILSREMDGGEAHASQRVRR